MKEKGFTLIELMVVITIIGIVSAFAVPNLLKSMPLTRLRGSADELRSTLIVARVRAISEGVPYIALFAADADTFSIIKDLNSDNAIDNGELVATYKYDSGITNDVIPAGNPSIVVFSPRGEASTTGSIRLTNTRNEKVTVHVVSSGSVLKELQ